jgi:D-3-phosphoglycerate dehydrogenase
MSVAALDREGLENKEGEMGNEALMILGVEGTVGKEVEAELRVEKGILNVSVVRL